MTLYEEIKKQVEIRGSNLDAVVKVLCEEIDKRDGHIKDLEEALLDVNPGWSGLYHEEVKK